MRRKGGFTLVELRVVVGILSVLIALFPPALQRARENARIVVCASNVRQIDLALIAYGNYNRGELPVPSAFDWFPRLNRVVVEDNYVHYSYTDGVFMPYLRGGPGTRKALFLCPSDGPEHPVLDPLQTSLPRNFTYNFTRDEATEGQRDGFVRMRAKGANR